MDWLARLFERPEEPLPEFDHPSLGRAAWSEDDEAWRGSFNGFTYLLSYEGEAPPAEDLCEYALRMLSAKDALMAKVETARNAALQDHPPFYREEISGLQLGVLYFYRNKKQLRILGDLDGGIDGRAWRIEFLDEHCEGVAFDS